ncbi:hypothetical protein K469DRAFT_518305, partial [Zopfia rhizophila CBS 207.26]
LPTIDGSDIDDKSKATWLTKSIALVQVVWFIAQIFGHAIQQLPVTTLELFTLSIVFCAAITRVSWWKKPFEVRKPI